MNSADTVSFIPLKHPDSKMVEWIKQYLQQPFPLWETEITRRLVKNKWDQLKLEGLDERTYNTTWFLRKKNPPQAAKSIPIGIGTIRLELPHTDELRRFYDEHGLLPLSEEEIAQNDAIGKLKAAFAMLNQINGVQDCIKLLVNSLQVVKQEDPEIDISHTHPEIPFTIFVSVCQDQDPISNLRVAESILHEAMHLKLTLIENVVPLVNPNSKNLFYSPWRDEMRSIKGVLHGLFVFRAILDFLTEMEKIVEPKETSEYINIRRVQITKELNQLVDFPSSSDLAQNGAHLTSNLLL